MRVRGFLAVVAIVLLFFVAVLYFRTPTGPADASSPAAVVDPPEVSLRTIATKPRVYVRSTKLDDSYGKVAIVPLDALGGARVSTGLVCDRVDVAGGTGVCLTASRGVLTTYSAVIFDEAELVPRKTIPLGGVPSRVRVAPNGRLAGMTVFVSGHAYSQAAFSTLTTLVDTATGEILADLESFDVRRDGRPFKHQDFNFWGVTFASDSNTFYATLSSQGVLYLIRGDAAARRAEVLAEGVECPSLSPNNARLAFKKRETTGGRLIWRLALYDPVTGHQTVLPTETRSVDDQAEWLDDRRLLYATPDPERPGSMIVSVIAVDEHAAPALFLADAYSPAVP